LDEDLWNRGDVASKELVACACKSEAHGEKPPKKRWGEGKGMISRRKKKGRST